MAKVLLISTAAGVLDFWSDEYSRIRRCVDKDVFKVHSITDDPGSADLIIFFEPGDPYLASDVRSHSYARTYPEKSFLFDPSDRVVPFLPGVYASIQKRRYDRSRVRPGFFPVVLDHEWIAYIPNGKQPDLLFSFVGDIQGNPVRKAIGRLSHPRAIIRDTGDDPANFANCADSVNARFHREFAATLADSKFTLCPRGAGASTIRIFETMKAGRVPVIISDDWAAPEGPRWESFSLNVRERDVACLPEFLEAHEGAAASMGSLAREHWEHWFSESTSFHRIVESCLSILRSRRMPERLMREVVLWQLLEPFNFRHKLVPGIRKRLGMQ